MHNPEISDDVRITVMLEGETTPKGISFVYLPKKKYLIVEETNDTIKMQVLE